MRPNLHHLRIAETITLLLVELLLLAALSGCNNNTQQAASKLPQVPDPVPYLEDAKDIQLKLYNTDYPAAAMPLDKLRAAFANTTKDPKPLTWSVFGSLKVSTSEGNKTLDLYNVDAHEGAVSTEVDGRREYWRGVNMDILKELSGPAK